MAISSVSTFHHHRPTPAASIAARRCCLLQSSEPDGGAFTIHDVPCRKFPTLPDAYARTIEAPHLCGSKKSVCLATFRPALAPAGAGCDGGEHWRQIARDPVVRDRPTQAEARLTSLHGDQGVARPQVRHDTGGRDGTWLDPGFRAAHSLGKGSSAIAP